MAVWQIGLIGCGWAGQQHARAVHALGDRARLRMVADIDGERAEDTANAWDVARWVTDYTLLLSDPALDIVSICLPHHLHAIATIQALAAGRHVMIEKPLATTLQEADGMIAAAENAGLCLMVGESVRFHNTYRQVAALIGQNFLGKIFLIRIAREHEMHDYLRKRPWFLHEWSGGIMVSGGIHDYELLRMLGGEIRHVYGLIAAKSLREMTADDTSVAIAQMHSGAVATLVESFSLKTPEPGVHGTIHGNRGSLWFSDDQIRLYTATADDQSDLVKTIRVPESDPFVAEWAHFLDCLDRAEEPITNAREQRKPLAAVVATYESFATGRQVAVSA